MTRQEAWAVVSHGEAWARRRTTSPTTTKAKPWATRTTRIAPLTYGPSEYGMGGAPAGWGGDFDESAECDLCVGDAFRGRRILSVERRRVG